MRAVALAAAVFFSGVAFAGCPPPVLQLSGYITPDGGVTTFLHGKTSDPYFGMSVVLWAQTFGLNATEVGERVIDHGLRTQRADGLFDKECEAAAGRWVSCGQADSEDATLAKWVELLYVQARARGSRRLPPAWQASADRALRALDRQELPSGIFSVFPPEDVAYAGYALYLDNLDVAQAFQTVSQVLRAWGQPRAADVFAQRHARLLAAIARQFGTPATGLRRLAIGANYTTSAFYPQGIAAPMAWLQGQAPLTPQDWGRWLRQYGATWFNQAQTNFPWGLMALLALKSGDSTVASQWLAHAQSNRVTNTRWNVLEETSAQIVAAATEQEKDWLCRLSW